MMKSALCLLLLIGLSLAATDKRNDGLCQSRKRNSSEYLQCVFNLLNSTKTPDEYKRMEILLLASQDTRRDVNVKRNGLCNTKRNVDLSCVLAFLNTAKDDADRLRIENLLMQSALSQ